jgi:hypothetical protein
VFLVPNSAPTRREVQLGLFVDWEKASIITPRRREMAHSENAARDGGRDERPTDMSSAVADSAHVDADGSFRSSSKKRQLVRVALCLTDGTDAAAGSSSTLVSRKALWRLAMRMSLRNDNRLLQHVSRSILSIGVHKVSLL